MPKEQTLVDYLVNVSQFTPRKIDTSMARRLIIEERVCVNDEIVTDPAFRLPSDEGFVVQTLRD